MHVDILAIGVHPDDIELAASGTLLKHIDQGYSVGLLDLTRGELGSRGSAEIRTREANDAANKLGANFRENLDLPDGFLQNDPATIRKIIRSIRLHTPRIVLTNALRDRHPDHGRAAKIVADACYYSGLIKIETQDETGNAQTHHRPEVVYHYIQDRARRPDLIVDITGYLGKKMELIRCFASQFEDEVNTEFADEVSTPISGSGFMDFVECKARVLGREAGVDFGEGFEVSRVPGVNNLFDLI